MQDTEDTDAGYGRMLWFYPFQSQECCRGGQVLVEAVRTQVEVLVEADTLLLVLFEELSPLDLEAGRICEEGHTLPRKFSFHHPFLVQSDPDELCASQFWWMQEKAERW